MRIRYTEKVFLADYVIETVSSNDPKRKEKDSEHTHCKNHSLFSKAQAHQNTQISQESTRATAVILIASSQQAYQRSCSTVGEIQHTIIHILVFNC